MTAKIFKHGKSMALRLPAELRLKEGQVVEIEDAGDHWVISKPKVRKRGWPKGFFERIKLRHPECFCRPDQGEFRPLEL